ncbi:MAG: hypothetical protein IIC33_09260, partial [Chloroflexi bacterium]|nr:hypothetical protein [Chloroflexota bacterium]
MKANTLAKFVSTVSLAVAAAILLGCTNSATTAPGPTPDIGATVEARTQATDSAVPTPPGESATGVTATPTSNAPTPESFAPITETATPELVITKTPEPTKILKPTVSPKSTTSGPTEFQEFVSKLPWVAAGGLNNYETIARNALFRLYKEDQALAMKLGGLPWAVDGITNDEKRAIGNIEDMGTLSIPLAQVVSEYPWVSDGITPNEWRALANLRQVAETDLPLGVKLAGLPWVSDEISDDELGALRSIRAVWKVNQQRAKTVVD